MEDSVLTFLRTLHAMAWCIYVGGAICMEFVLKHAQDYMKPSQTAVVCLRAGTLYRWWSLSCLLTLLLSGLALAGFGDKSISQSGAYGWLILALLVIWCVQLGILALLAFYFHPEMHLRVASSMSAEEVQVERRRVGAAITNMALTVRIELGLALLAVSLGVAVHLV